MCCGAQGSRHAVTSPACGGGRRALARGGWGHCQHRLIANETPPPQPTPASGRGSTPLATTPSRDAPRPSLAQSSSRPNRGRRESRCSERTRSSACEKQKARRQSPPQVHRKSPAFPARWCYDLFRALSGDRAFCHRRRRNARALSPTSRQHRGAKTTRLRRPLTRAFVPRTASVHRIPHPTFRDDREAPLLSGTGRANRCQ